MFFTKPIMSQTNTATDPFPTSLVPGYAACKSPSFAIVAYGYDG